ncbi:hypothetical protein [Prescottella equi]|uniref:hypothetical protein n=1 Tax=Rhodococcus hoagii TaxID=43767 RepID=UPI0023D99BBE|nr:hypothetical protein [Prescottella equi]
MSQLFSVTIVVESEGGGDYLRASIPGQSHLGWTRANLPDLLADVAFGIEELVAQAEDAGPLNRVDLYGPMGADKSRPRT